MKNTLMVLCFCLSILAERQALAQAGSIPRWFGPHQWTANVKVIGEDGDPIRGADVSVQYSVLATVGASQPTFGEIKGLTDTNGAFATSHADSSWDLGVSVEKSGFYTTHIGYQFYDDDKRRHPAFTLMLKKIGKPIPMYAKSITYIDFPAFNQPIGYDLTVGDWIAPYGKGLRADFLFTENHADAKSGYTITVSFPNQGDGIQEFTRDSKLGVSSLVSLNEAPVDGYQPKYEKTQMSNPDRIYYFRVQTKLDDNGNIVSAHYGKIYGDFMQFKYYLNPTPNDRNIEFDPKQNLIGGLRSFEQVRDP